MSLDCGRNQIQRPRLAIGFEPRTVLLWGTRVSQQEVFTLKKYSWISFFLKIHAELLLKGWTKFHINPSKIKKIIIIIISLDHDGGSSIEHYQSHNSTMAESKNVSSGFFCFFLKCSETVYQFAWLSSWCKALTLLLCVREQQKHEHDSALFSVFKHYSLTVMLIVCHWCFGTSSFLSDSRLLPSDVLRFVSLSLLKDFRVMARQLYHSCSSLNLLA